MNYPIYRVPMSRVKISADGLTAEIPIHPDDPIIHQLGAMEPSSDRLVRQSCVKLFPDGSAAMHAEGVHGEILQWISTPLGATKDIERIAPRHWGTYQT